ncbi:MAG: response regulator [Desulfobacteraceae bacterium]|nr:response regulator [Desulfobacteraceae bacterium]
MAIISIFSGKYSGAAEIVKKLEENHGYKLIRDNEVIEAAALKFNENKDIYEKAFFNPPSVFNSFTREKEKAMAELKVAISELLDDNQVFYGFSSLLIPRKINHVVKILTIADQQYRIQNAANLGLSEKNAKKEILQADEKAAEFSHHIKNSGPWNPSLYDMVIPMDKTTTEKAYELILSQLGNPVLQYSEESKKRINDFILEAKVGLELCRQGFDVDVDAEGNDVSLTINKKVLFLSKLKNELTSAAKTIEGVSNVETKIGQNFYKADILTDQNFSRPHKVLLVDDEVDFIQTLSERLAIRDMPSFPVSSGREALEIMDRDHPEVMVLDLKMPGVDGYEVLRKTKEKSPETEIIILTGHGNETDRERCMELGAFAYLEKPADIDLLTKTMKEAYENIQKKTTA